MECLRTDLLGENLWVSLDDEDDARVPSLPRALRAASSSPASRRALAGASASTRSMKRESVT
jgi:hypothetical protein